MKFRILFAAGLMLFPSLLLARTYDTKFPATENPISENGNWINGKTNGFNWSDVRTTTGFAFGTQSGSSGYDDSTAVLTGPWGPNQTACATARIPSSLTASYEELELRLRTSITGGRITGYEINFSASSASNAYIQIVRWNGAYGDFTYVATRTGPGIHTGDRLCASIVTDTNNISTISVWINGGSPILKGTDNTFSNGSPGIGFYLEGGTSAKNADFGWTSFNATDGVSTAPPAPPTGLQTVPH
jgi:hypothetical protein